LAHGIVERGFGAFRAGHAALIGRVRRFKILPEAFTIESGMMTPTLKLKRQAIYKAYDETISELYKGRVG
jgi:long-subunit acyl-CoA synthetase (AMP-forming)